MVNNAGCQQPLLYILESLSGSAVPSRFGALLEPRVNIPGL